MTHLVPVPVHGETIVQCLGIPHDFLLQPPPLILSRCVLLQFLVVWVGSLGLLDTEIQWVAPGYIYSGLLTVWLWCWPCAGGCWGRGHPAGSRRRWWPSQWGRWWRKVRRRCRRLRVSVTLARTVLPWSPPSWHQSWALQVRDSDLLYASSVVP